MSELLHPEYKNSRSFGIAGQCLRFVRDHRIEFVVGETLWLTHFFAGNSIDANNVWTNILPFVSMARAAGQDFAYALGTTATELSKAAILAPFFSVMKTGVLKGLEYKDKLKEKAQRLKEGREAITSSAILTIDTTNEPGTGNHEGDFVQALRKHKQTHISKWKIIENAFGPICEIVREDTPQPVETPKERYIRMKANGYRDPDTLKARGAEHASSLIACALDQGHTVFDNHPEAQRKILDVIPRIIGAFDNIEELVKLKLGKPTKLPKIAVVNDRKQSQLDLIGPKLTAATEPGTLADFFPKYQGYDTIVAEEVVVKHLLKSLAGKRVVIAYPTEDKDIATNFLTYIQEYITKHEIKNAPIFEDPNDQSASETLNQQRPDVIFVLGENDTGVTRAVESIIQHQATEITTPTNYPICPIVTLLEGHSADSTIKRISDFIQSEAVVKDNLNLRAIYLHDLLAHEVVERLYSQAKKKSQRIAK